MSVASKRASSKAVNPLTGNENLVQPMKNILTSTLEQSMIFLMLSLVLTTYLERSELQILPLYSILWIMGRIFFAVGYRIHPKYRSVGTGINFISTFFFFGVIGFMMYARGFLYRVVSETRGDTTSVHSRTEL